MVNLKSIFIMAIYLMLVSLWAPAATAEIEVSIDRNPVQVNESFQLVFSLEQSPDREPDFSSLRQHFLILGNNRSSTISIVNGEYRRSIKYNLQLMPKQVGEFMIPAIRFDQERSKAFQITVKPSSLAAQPQDPLVFEVLADKTETYVQSQVLLSLRLLSATGISAYQFGDILIENIDTVVEPLGDAREYQTRIADKSYLVLEQKFALFPQQAGRLEVAPLSVEVRLQSRSNFDPFRRGGEVRRLNSQPVFIDVEPIPPEFKAAHWLPAQRLELRENWQGDLNALVAGEPITRSLTLIADGLTAAQLPQLTLTPIDGIKQYPDQPGLENSRSNNGIRGKREQKVALIPGAAGSYRVPEINLSWWNLQTGRLEIATIPERELIVSAAAAAAISAPEPVIEPAPAANAPAVESSRFWLWLSLLLACGWGLSALYWWYRARPAPPPPAAFEPPALGAARSELRRACETADAAAARLALLRWGQALFAPRPLHNLHQLSTHAGPEFARQVEILNTSLYAKTRDSWQGAELLRLCQQLERGYAQDQPRETRLMPLNPVG